MSAALEDYEIETLQEVTQNTIVLMLGDARNNRNDPRASVFEKIKDRCKYTFWLNPKVKEKWNTGDSMLDRYEDHLDGIYEVASLSKLESALYDIEEYVAMAK